MNYEKMIVERHTPEFMGKVGKTYRELIIGRFYYKKFNNKRKEIELSDVAVAYRKFIDVGFMHIKVTSFADYCEIVKKQGYVII
jgi:hypothetical protein